MGHDPCRLPVLLDIITVSGVLVGRYPLGSEWEADYAMELLGAPVTEYTTVIWTPSTISVRAIGPVMQLFLQYFERKLARKYESVAGSLEPRILADPGAARRPLSGLAQRVDEGPSAGSA